jgi:hypothetical protein
MLTGDDVFISYSRRDGTTYVTGRADELAKQGLRCRLDLWETDPDRELPAKLKRAIAGAACSLSSRLSMPSIPGMLRAKLLNSDTRRQVIPVSCDGTTTDNLWLYLECVSKLRAAYAGLQACQRPCGQP